jgi:hypothetical protein
MGFLDTFLGVFSAVVLAETLKAAFRFYLGKKTNDTLALFQDMIKNGFKEDEKN